MVKTDGVMTMTIVSRGNIFKSHLKAQLYEALTGYFPDEFEAKLIRLNLSIEHVFDVARYTDILRISYVHRHERYMLYEEEVTHSFSPMDAEALLSDKDIIMDMAIRIRLIGFEPLPQDTVNDDGWDFTDGYNTDGYNKFS